jgi:phage terminase small subunit
MPLGPKQARFVEEYLKDLNATQAAIRAGYSPKTAETQGSRLFRNVQVSKAISEALARRSARVEVKSDDILRELMRLAMVDIGQAFDEEGKFKALHEMPEDVRRAISGIEVDELFEGSGRDRTQVGWTKKIKFWDKVRGLELLGKHVKLFTENHQHQHSGLDGGPISMKAEVSFEPGRISGILGLLAKVGAIPERAGAGEALAGGDSEADAVHSAGPDDSSSGLSSS